VKACFVDTSFFLALFGSDDTNHRKAVQANSIDRPLLTSYWVLLELGDHMRHEGNREVFSQFLPEIGNDPRYEIVPAEQRLLDQAIALYRDRRDKDWSLTDCTSFILMRERGLQEALSADHHFEQAGFTLLLKNE
jgi:hypothetical protein